MLNTLAPMILTHYFSTGMAERKASDVLSEQSHCQLPSELNLAPRTPSPGWHVFRLLLLMSNAKSHVQLSTQTGPGWYLLPIDS